MKAQEGHKGEAKAQGEQGEDANSVHEESHASNRHMTWWRNAWCVRMDNGPHLRTARGRRRAWRAATRAAREAHETEQVAGGEREKWEQETTERTGEKRKQHTARCLPLPEQRKRDSHCNKCNHSSSNRSSTGSSTSTRTTPMIRSQSTSS